MVKIFALPNYRGSVALQAGVGYIVLTSFKIGSMNVPAGLNVTITTIRGKSLIFSKNTPNVNTNVSSILITSVSPTVAPTLSPSNQPTLVPTATPTAPGALFYSGCNYVGFLYEFIGINTFYVPPTQVIQSVQLTGGLQLSVFGTNQSVTTFSSSNPCFQLPAQVMQITLFTSASPTTMPSNIPSSASPTTLVPSNQPSYPTLQPSYPTNSPSVMPTIALSCPSGYKSTEGFCLQYLASGESLADAKADCAGRSNGWLVSVTDANKNRIVQGLIRNISWLGIAFKNGTNISSSSNINWAHGESSPYSNWEAEAHKKGSVSGSFGAVITTSGNWTVSPAATLHPYICETSGGRLMQENNTAAKMIHRLSFTDPTGVKDLTGNATATLHGGAVLSNGQLILRWNGGATPKPYVQLSPGVLNAVDAVTIEIWGSFDSTYPSNAALFSFGDVNNNITFSGNLAGLSAVHVVVVYNPPMGYSKLYLDGYVQSINTLSSRPLVGALGASEPYNYIGRNRLDSAPGAACAISEFRIYSGELTKKQVYSNFLIGDDPSHVSLSSSQLYKNVNIIFMATSTQSFRIGFYGGASVQAPMFGYESLFTIAATDSQCGYSITVPIDPLSSSIRRSLAAMNYTVTFASQPPAPSFVIDPYTYCDASVDPYSYLNSIGGLSQTLTMPYVDDTSYYFVNFTYRSGVCFVAGGTEMFATVQPIPQFSGLTCFKTNSTMFIPGDQTNISITQLEYYPQDSSWASQPFGLCSSPTQDKFVENSIVNIMDLISGRPHTQHFEYNSTLVHRGSGLALFPQGLMYEIKAGVIRPSPPFDLTLDIISTRMISSYASTVQVTFYVPILGSIPMAVPNVYPASTNPNLIFLVLRDPPGGSSKCSIKQGTVFDTSISIEGVQSTSQKFGLKVEGTLAGEEKVNLITAPLGIGTAEDLLEFSFGVGVELNTEFEYKTSWTTNTGYSLALTFSSEFSTSDDGYTAGHPSDVIVGGGVDLFVTEALEVYSNRTTLVLTCLNVRNTYVWHPGKVTTFSLSAMKISETIDRLSTIRDNEQGSGNFDIVKKLDKQISNWNSVLRNYRADNRALTAVFSTEERRLNRMMNEYDSYLNGMWKTYTDVSLIQSVLGIVVDVVAGLAVLSANPVAIMGVLATFGLRAAVSVIYTILGGLLTRCSFVAPSSASSILNSACNDFDVGKWTRMIDVLDGACTMPLLDAPTDGQKADFRSKYCQSGSVSSKDVEGGLSGDGQISMFGFLKDSNKLLTFSARADVSMSWASAVKTSRSFSTDLEVAYTQSNGGHSEGKVSIGVDLEGKLSLAQDTTQVITIGKSTEQSHEAEREVSISLGDGDLGDYFAIRITEDPVYGTPVFTTLGGASKCPGETSTSRRDSNVRIVTIQPRCGLNKRSPCTHLNLGSQDYARFGVVIENLSPTQDEVYYTLEFVEKFESYYTYNWRATGPGACGTPGARNFLSAQFQETDLQRIPYNKWIESPMTVGAAGSGATWSAEYCYKFVDVAMRIIATCEQPEPNNRVYQYGFKYDDTLGEIVVSYDASDLLYALNSTATFSVDFPPNVADVTTNMYQRRELVGDQSTPFPNRAETLEIKIKQLDEKVEHLNILMSVVTGLVTLMMAGMIFERLLVAKRVQVPGEKGETKFWA